MIEEDTVKQNSVRLRYFGAVTLLFVAMQWSAAQAAPGQAGVPVSMVVTVGARHSADLPDIGSKNVIVSQSRARAEVTEWVPLQGERAGLELFILLDDSSNISQGSQVEDIRRFILAQPATTKVGVAYMQDGGLKIVQNLTEDHAQAASAVHISLGRLARSASPYASLGDLIKQWPTGKDRREVLMISSGVDSVSGDNGPGRDDIYVDAVIEQAQRAGVVVFAIGTSSEEINSGQAGVSKNYLAQVAEETGGQSYYRQTGPLTSFVPYLDDASLRLNRQYLLTFLAKPEKKAGTQPVKVRTDVAHAEIVSAERVFVPAAQ
jgi:hypothetical protein